MDLVLHRALAWIVLVFGSPLSGSRSDRVSPLLNLEFATFCEWCLSYWWYIKMAGNNLLVDLIVMLWCLTLVFIMMIACMIIGYPIAYFLAMYAHRSKYFILLILIIPLFMSYIIKIYMMRSILGYSGLINKLLSTHMTN